MQYHSFAQYYDRMMHDVDYESWIAYVVDLLKKSSVKTVLDAACGTGRITIGLAKRGFWITGSDCSEEMLMEARKNALEAGCKSIPFVCRNMTELCVHKPVDAVISTCDGVNYLTDLDQVRQFFRSANRCLRPNGLLLFDISSYHKLSDTIGENTFTEVEDEYAYIWENMFDPESQLLEMNLTFFVREGMLFRRFFEQHLQRAHRMEELCTLLEKEGFALIGAYEAFSEERASEDAERIYTLNSTLKQVFSI